MSSTRRPLVQCSCPYMCFLKSLLFEDFGITRLAIAAQCSNLRSVSLSTHLVEASVLVKLTLEAICCFRFNRFFWIPDPASTARQIPDPRSDPERWTGCHQSTWSHIWPQPIQPFPTSQFDNTAGLCIFFFSQKKAKTPHAGEKSLENLLLPVQVAAIHV